MQYLAEPPPMAKKTAAPPPPDRVTVLNVKGTVAERDFLHNLSRKTGVSVAEMTRRALSAWALKRGAKSLPDDWIAE